MTPTDNAWGEDQRLGLSIHHALEDATKRLKVLKGKNKRALKQEFHEWTECDDLDEIDIQWILQYKEW
tara:strand:- start:245 stop:448 length:204 start_codon:yes stop_codon:yes gene_type:complete